jgi:hypothetical protein
LLAAFLIGDLLFLRSCLGELKRYRSWQSRQQCGSSNSLKR